MMEKGGGGRRLVFLCAVATLLIISSSAVSGDLERDLGKIVGRLERRRSHGGGGGVISHVTEEPKPEQLELELDAVVGHEKKPAEGILEKARSFLASIGNGISNPTSEKKHLAGPEKVERTFGRKGHIFGRHHGFGHSRWAGIRDLIRNHPERLAAAAAGISATEPLALDEEAIPVIPVSELRAKIRGILTTVIWEDKAVTVEPNLASTCADAVETQVKVLVKSVKSALREQLCNGDVASMEEQTFCNFFDIHPMIQTFQSFRMIHVNPVKVAWHQTSKTAACSSENPFSSFRDSLQEMEGLARQFSLHRPEVIDTEGKHLEHEDEHHMFHRHKREHGDHERHWWQRLLHMKPHHFEGKHSEREDEHHMFYRHRHEHGDPERHWWQRMLHMKPHHFEERQEHGDHVHWKQRLFRMFHKHNQMSHQGFEHAYAKSPRDICFDSSVKHLNRNLRRHLVISCESTTSPNVIKACKFAKEHHFLVKAWLAVKIPMWSEAAKSCIDNFEVRQAPDLGIGRVGTVERENLVDEDLASSEAGKTNERQLNTVPHWIKRRCAKNHADRGFSKALHLRGHVIGIHHGENGPRELVRTHLIVLGGLPLHLSDFQNAFENSQPLDHSSAGDMLTDLQDRLAEFLRDTEVVRDAVSGEHRVLPGLNTEIMALKPVHHHANFHISANPRVLPMTGGPRFRISAMPRVVREADSEMPVIGNVHVVEDVAGDIDSEVKLQDNTPRETAELRADM